MSGAPAGLPASNRGASPSQLWKSAAWGLRRASRSRQLTEPLKRYTLAYPNDLTELKRQVRKGDVILVEGNERVSQVIKYLTQSSWSHSTLYVGDEAIKRDPELRLKLAQEYGEEANYMVVEAKICFYANSWWFYGASAQGA
jgi:hypothetical protein